VELVENPDILAELGRTRRDGQVLVGFAAETNDPLEGGRAKLAAKGADFIVVNEVGETVGFESPDNSATILGADGSSVDVARGPKEQLADAVWDLVVEAFR
jgi:phosphopantothenoylcysteine decarboxylase/phosphopantothenate--cysteine ligase